MPFRKELYPPDWPVISRRIRDRAGNRCEWCGAENYKPHPITGSKVILTVAHMNENKMDVSDENLRALCQRCHLNYDREYHMRNAATTRHNNKLAAGQLEFDTLKRAGQ